MDRLGQIRKKLDAQYVLDDPQKDCAYLLGVVDALNDHIRECWKAVRRHVSRDDMDKELSIVLKRLSDELDEARGVKHDKV